MTLTIPTPDVAIEAQTGPAAVIPTDAGGGPVRGARRYGQQQPRTAPPPHLSSQVTATKPTPPVRPQAVLRTPQRRLTERNHPQ